MLKAFKYLQKGISEKVVSPVAFAEIRRRFPNNLGVPLEVGAILMLNADISANGKLGDHIVSNLLGRILCYGNISIEW